MSVKYEGIKDIWIVGEEKPVPHDVYSNGTGRYFTQGGTSEPKRFVIFNLDKRRFEFKE